MEHTDQLLQRFEEVFEHRGERLYFSPGRVNLIGEHTDYNGGKVFPCAITIGTYAVVSKREDNKVRAYSENLSELGVISFELEKLEYEEQSNWTNYLKGMLLYMQEIKGDFEYGFDAYIYGTIPNGASLSSSASLEVLTGVIANDLYELNFSGEDIALLGQRVENEFLNLKTGIMDQFIIANAQKNHALLLDTNSLKYEQVPLALPNHTLVIMNSLKRRELVDSAYNERRQQCETAVDMLQKVVSISTLGELTEKEFEQYKYAITDEVVARRAKHAVYENERTKQAANALKNGQLELFGQLMNDSHLSLHKDYEVTVRETDLLVRLAWRQEGVIGARMTGGGFGGCCIAIVENDAVDEFIKNVGAGYKAEIGYEPEFYLAETEDRAKRIK